MTVSAGSTSSAGFENSDTYGMASWNKSKDSKPGSNKSNHQKAGTLRILSQCSKGLQN